MSELATQRCYTTKRISELYGLSCSTILHYEKLGLLDQQHIVGLSNGYRQFNQAAVERIMLIRHGKHAGFSLKELAQYIQKWEEGSLTLAEKCALFEAQARKIDQKIAELQQAKAYISAKLQSL